MSIPCDNNFLLVQSSRSSLKVKINYQGHGFRKKNGLYGGISVSYNSLFVFENDNVTKILPLYRTVPSSNDLEKDGFSF